MLFGPCWASLVHDWQESNGMSHSEDIFVERVWSSPCKTDPPKVLGSCTGFEDAEEGGVLLKRCFSQEVKRSDPSLCSALGDMIFLLAAQAFEGDIEV